MNLLEVNQQESTVSVFFWIKLEWKNEWFAFLFLNDDFRFNDVEKMIGANETYFQPILRYYHIFDNQLTTLKKTIYIEKRNPKKVSLSEKTLRPEEVYEGSENTFTMDVLHRKEF